MAVVTKTSPEAAVRDPVKQLAVGSFLGALYVLLSLGIVFGQLPIVWDSVWESLGLGNPFLSEALLLIVTLGVIVGLFFVGRMLDGPHPQPGLHAGVFVAAVGLLLALLISLGLGNPRVAAGDVGLGLGLAAVSAVVLVGGLVWLFLRPAFAQLLVRFDEQGWFHATQFKASQGVRVRRATFIGLLVLIGCGIYTMWMHHTLGAGNWTVDLLNTGYTLTLLFHVDILGLILILLGLGWVAWRVVNWPVFADFLIATEAELNKVSWTTRRRLIQDTIVVLVTVLLMAVFLFVVDIVWIRVLTAPGIKVLQVDLKEAREKQRQAQEW
jgi:preprotein translocase SecE subunit